MVYCNFARKRLVDFNPTFRLSFYTENGSKNRLVILIQLVYYVLKYFQCKKLNP